LYSGRRWRAASVLSPYRVCCRRILDASLGATCPCNTTALSTRPPCLLGQSEAPDPGGDGLHHHHILTKVPRKRARGGGGGIITSTLGPPIDSKCGTGPAASTGWAGLSIWLVGGAARRRQWEFWGIKLLDRARCARHWQRAGVRAAAAAAGA